MQDIQHTQMILGMAIGLAMLGTFLLSLSGHWIGGPWTILLGTSAAVLLAYQPLIGASLFAGFKTDLLRRILLAVIPFTAISTLLSLKKIPVFARLIFALIGPALVMGWVFAHFDVAVPRLTMFTQKIVPVAIAIAATWALIEPVAHRSPGAAAPIVIGAGTAGLAFLLLLSSENQAGLMAPIIPATAGGAVLAAIFSALLRKPISFARGPVLLWLTLIALLLAFLWLDTDKLPLPYLYILATVPLLGWIPELGPLHRLKPWKRETVRLSLVLIPTLIAITLAFKQHKKEAIESGDEYGTVYPAAPIFPSQIPMPKTINPPTIT